MGRNDSGALCWFWLWCRSLRDGSTIIVVSARRTCFKEGLRGILLVERLRSVLVAPLVVVSEGVESAAHHHSRKLHHSQHLLLESLLHVDIEAALLSPVLSFVRVKALIFVQILRIMEVGTVKDHIAVVVVVRFFTTLDFHLRMKGRRYTYGTLTGANAEYPLDLLALHFPVHGTTLDVTEQIRPSLLLRTASSTRTWDAGACLPPMLRPDRSC